MFQSHTEEPDECTLLRRGEFLNLTSISY